MGIEFTMPLNEMVASQKYCMKFCVHVVSCSQALNSNQLEINTGTFGTLLM